MNSTFNILPASQNIFSWTDYTMFVTMLAISVVIGIYHGYFGKKQNNTNDYLLGGKTMKVFPVSMSIIASQTSGIAMLSVPADIYVFGAMYVWISISIIIVCVLCSYVFMPVFVNLPIHSTYEYFNLRFNNKVRKLAALLFIISVVLYNAIVLYVPALAFSQVTGIKLYIVSLILCVICIFYTTIGGLRGVVWTDTIQTVSIVGSMLFVLCLGIVSAGGFQNIWEKSLEGDRLDVFDFSVDPTKRNTFWAVLLGSIGNWMALYSINQATIQRLMSVPSITHAKRAILVSCIGIVIVKIASSLTGLIIFAIYSNCDPITTKQVAKSDQLLPYYVLNVARDIPGLSGLFIAGVVSAGLSSLSTTLNSMAGTIYKDFILSYMPTDTSQKRASNILKLIVVISGAINIVLVLVVEQLGSVLPLFNSVNALTGSVLVGLFTLGMLCPSANSKGALTAGIIGLMFNCWMIFGSQYYSRMGMLEDFSKPTSVKGCDFLVNATVNSFTERYSPADRPFFLFRLTFWYHNLAGLIVTIFVGLVASWITKKADDPPVDRKLLSPVIHFLLPMRETDTGRSVDYIHLDKALKLVIINSEED